MAHDSADDFVAIAYVVIVITAAAALVGADKDEGVLSHVKRRAVTLIWPLAAENRHPGGTPVDLNNPPVSTSLSAVDRTG